MSELQTLLKKFTIDPVVNESFVYYDTAGKIFKISSSKTPSEDYSILSVPSKEIETIITGEKKTEDFLVTYDVSLKQMRIKEIAYDDSFNTAATMTYKLPVIRQVHDSHFTLNRIYEGVDVYIWDQTKGYNTNDYVFYKNSIYRIKEDITPNKKFNTRKHQKIIGEVKLTTIPTQAHTIEQPVFTQQYNGIKIDVWYDNLDHLAGQHVWHNNCVYKILKDQAANTIFSLDNTEILIDNVKLFDDENEHLPFDTKLYLGDLVLKNNSLYSVSFEKVNIEKDKSLIYFYNSKNTKIVFDPNENFCTEYDLNKNTDIKIENDISLDVKRFERFNVKDNGKIVLCGRYLYQIEVSRDYDIIIQQNTIFKHWNIQINPYTKKFLRTSGYKPNDNLYFSLTAKHDPNLLIRSLQFKISDLLAHDDQNPIIPFKYESESDPNDVSIFTAKYFDSYAHEVI